MDINKGREKFNTNSALKWWQSLWGIWKENIEVWSPRGDIFNMNFDFVLTSNLKKKLSINIFRSTNKLRFAVRFRFPFLLPEALSNKLIINNSIFFMKYQKQIVVLMMKEVRPEGPRIVRTFIVSDESIFRSSAPLICYDAGYRWIKICSSN